MLYRHMFALNYRSHRRYLLLHFYRGVHARATVCFTNTHFIRAIGPTMDSQHLELIKKKKKSTRSTEKKAWHFTQGFCCSYLHKGIVDQQCDDLEKSAWFCDELISCPFHISRRLEKLTQFWFIIVYIVGSCFVFYLFHNSVLLRNPP